MSIHIVRIFTSLSANARLGEHTNGPSWLSSPDRIGFAVQLRLILLRLLSIRPSDQFAAAEPSCEPLLAF